MRGNKVRPLNSTGEEQPSSEVMRLVDPSGERAPATAQDAARLVNEASFAWLDVESPDDELPRLGQALQLDPETVTKLVRADPRPTFTTTRDAIYAALPAAEGSQGTQPTKPAYLCAALTERFLLTVHAGPCSPVREARDRYSVLRDDAKSDGPLVLFLVLDQLISSFEPELLALNERLDQIQAALLDGSPSRIRDEIINIRRALTDTGRG